MNNNIKEILLITFTNNLYREKLTSTGYMVTEFSQPLDDESIDSIKKIRFKGTAILEIIEDSMHRLEDVLDRLIKDQVRIIAVTARINNNLRDYFLEHGIAEVIESNSGTRLAGYIDITSKYTNKKYGNILILEDDPRRINILVTIIGRFNFTSIIAQTIDKLFENIAESNIQFLLVNIGVKDFEITEFLRRFSSGNKHIPVIPYKDKGKGLFIHEMISGLNRIAKVILYSEEVYSFLVDILFRKELSPGLNLLNETLDSGTLNRFAFETLSKIYSQLGIDIFTMKKIITKDNMDIINGRIDSLKDLIIKVDGFIWLIKEGNAGQSVGLKTKNTEPPDIGFI